MSNSRWKKLVKKRDGYVCRRCGFDKNLHVHHILPKAKYQIFRYHTNNGLTLCGNCHSLLKDKEEQTDLRRLIPDDPKIDIQLKALLKNIYGKNMSINKRLKAYLEGDVSKRIDRLVKINLLRGKGKFRREEYDLAIAIYNDILCRKPDCIEAYYYRGKAKYELKRYKAAIYDYDSALCLKPNDFNFYFNRGRSKYALKQYKSAITDYDMVLLLTPDNASAYNNRGLARYKLEQYDAAIADFDKAIDLNPDNVSPYYYRGRAKYEQELLDEAIADFDKVIRLNPDFGKVSHHRERAFYDQVISLTPANAFAYYYRGRANDELGQDAAASMDYNIAINLNPKICYDVLLQTIFGLRHRYHSVNLSLL